MFEITCPKCDKTVKESQNSILCGICNLWLHLKCSGLNKAGFRLLTDNYETGWVCRNYTRNTLPFHNLNKAKFLKEISAISSKSVSSWNIVTNQTIGYDKTCSVCTKNIRVDKAAIPCGNCKHLFHIKCAQLSNFSINNINSHLNEWDCTSCKKRV